MKRLLIYVAVAVVLGSSAGTAQVIYNSASTAAEGYANGMSNVISAQGQKNLSDSQAAINLTQARNSQIDNQVKSVNAFWEKKDIYNERQQKEFAEVQRQRQTYLAKYGLKSLTPEEFDRATGVCNWPRVLTQSQYDPYRLELDKLLKQRAYAGFLSGDEYIQATAACKNWRGMLAKQKKVYPEQILDQMIRYVLKVTRELDENLS
jgi:opacity protein-like surface antigen